MTSDAAGVTFAENYAIRSINSGSIRPDYQKNLHEFRRQEQRVR